MKAKRVWGLVLAAAMCMAVAGCGQEAEETATTEPQYQVIGTEAEGAYDILLKNSIGQDVTGISVKTSDEEAYPANMLASDAVLKNGETAEWFYMPEEAAETEGVGEKDVALNVVYQVHTNWQQGTLTFSQLQNVILELFHRCRVLGADICGECADALFHAADDKVILQDDSVNGRLLHTLMALGNEEKA